jgi:hypothetical protein
MTPAELIACVESMQPSEKTRFCALLTDYFPPPMVVLAPDHDDRSELEELKKKARKAMRTNSQHMGIAPFPIKYEQVDPEVPLVHRKFVDMLRASGINVVREAAAPIHAANLIVTKHEVSPDGIGQMDPEDFGPTCADSFAQLFAEARAAGVIDRLIGAQITYRSDADHICKMRAELTRLKAESGSAGPSAPPEPFDTGVIGATLARVREETIIPASGPPGDAGRRVVLTEAAFLEIQDRWEVGGRGQLKPISPEGVLDASCRIDDPDLVILLPTRDPDLPYYISVARADCVFPD